MLLSSSMPLGFCSPYMVRNRPTILLPLGLLVISRVDVETEALGIKVQLVLSTRLLEDGGDIPGVLNLSKLDVASALLDRVTNQFCRSGLTLCADDSGLLLLPGLVHHECCSLCFLLGDLLGFNGGGKFGRE